MILHKDLQIEMVKQIIIERSTSYKHRLKAHPNMLVENLLTTTNDERRLKRYAPQDLWTSA